MGRRTGVALLLGSALLHPSSSASCPLGSPCPLPPWEPTWQLNRSTAINAMNASGLLDPIYASRFGLVSLDWMNAEVLWGAGDAKEATCEATNVMNCKLIKEVNPHTRCFIYHNMELALEWLESQRALMYEAWARPFFLRYQDGRGRDRIYNERIQYGDQYFWDFRSPQASMAFITSVLKSVDSPYVDGTYLDDIRGTPIEHGNVPLATGMTADEISHLQNATLATARRMIEQLVARGKYAWQAFGYEDEVGPCIDAATCVAFMRQACSPSKQEEVWTMGSIDSDHVNETVAAFLIGRGPHAYIGWGWSRHEQAANLAPVFDMDVGEPLELCQEGSNHVFTRRWSRGVASLDCMTFKATLQF